MVRDYKQRRWIGERNVVGEAAGIDVAVRANQRQLSNRLIELAGDVTHCGIGVEIPVGMTHHVRIIADPGLQLGGGFLLSGRHGVASRQE